MTIFKNRTDAGRTLAEALSKYEGDPAVVVLALPRGGVPVGFEVANALNAPLDVFLVRKLGVPGHEELAMGAIASAGVLVLNEGVVNTLNISERTVESVATRERAELERRERTYRGNRRPVELAGKIAILVDDGLATGASMRAAVAALRSQQPSRIVVAVPTGPAETCRSFRDQADEVICLTTPGPFAAVGQWYDDFAQTTDEEVRHLLELADSLPRQSVPFQSERGVFNEQESLADRGA